MKIYECRKGHKQYEIELAGFSIFALGTEKGLCGICNQWCEVIADTDDTKRISGLEAENMSLKCCGNCANFGFDANFDMDCCDKQEDSKKLYYPDTKIHLEPQMAACKHWRKK